ncbi:MAG: hypothetical protein FJ138_00425 [Deltaproteobacteria bacterium]|nr:hypothetical protein [Deltaproteobacteria bacterium]
MSYTPRTREELARLALGAIIARSDLSDTARGSVIDTLSQAIGALAASVEQQIGRVREAFDFRAATGAELDARLLELPLSTISRLQATRASGTARLTVTASASPRTLEAGATFSASAAPALIFQTLAPLVIGAGVTAIDATVEALDAGRAGNIAAGALDTLDSAPPYVIAVTNPSAFGGGLDEEGDEALKRRAQLYLQSLARSQPAALRYLALALASTAGRIILADVYEPDTSPGYAELYIDDGTGALAARTAPGAQYTDTAGPAGARVLYFDAPAVLAPVPQIYNGAAWVDLAPSAYRAIPERGVIYLNGGAIGAGVAWRLKPYTVYTGLIAELQREVEGDPANPSATPGARAAGTRVRVLPALPFTLNFDLTLLPTGGADLDALSAQLTAALIDLTYSLDIGAPLFVAQIIAAAMALEGVANVRAYRQGTGGTATPEPLDDVYPPLDRVLRIGRLTLVPTSEET